MNVMKEAHQIVRETIAACASVKLNYRSLFRAALIDLHRKFKEMTSTVKSSDIKSACTADTSATDFVIEGTAVDSEGEQIHIGFSTGSEGAAQKEAEYFLNSSNGFTKVDIYLVMHYVNKGPKEFKIVK